LNKLVKILIPILVILGLLLAAGCAGKQASVTTPPYATGTVPAPASAPTLWSTLRGPSQSSESTGNTYSDSSQSAAGGTGATDTDRKIVKNGDMTLEVNDITVAITGVAKVATDLNGYVVSSNKQGDQDITYGQISIRVPSDRFDEAFDKLRKLAVNVPNERTDSQDVTEQYTDLQAQLRNLEATEAQYLEILTKAEKVEDILAVQRELSNVRGQIEQLKGRIQYLDRTSDMALINVYLQKTKPLGGTAWSALETLKSAARGLVSFGKVLANILIWVAVFSPVWIIILVVVLYFTRWRKAKARVSRK
jgi:multidrug efflux pump subunit AcrA (membrane-fusion protein)